MSCLNFLKFQVNNTGYSSCVAVVSCLLSGAVTRKEVTQGMKPPGTNGKIAWAAVLYSGNITKGFLILVQEFWEVNLVEFFDLVI